MEAKEEYKLIAKIAKRAVKMAASFGLKYDHLSCVMDISSCHAEIPLHLELLLTADDFNFSHDVFGIYKHINRNTAKMEGCFLPRYAQSQLAAAE